MDSLVTKLLAKQFKKFIKGFKQDQFTVNLLKGKASLSDIDLDEQFLQEVLMLPPNTEIRQCKCNELSVTLPNYTKLSEKAVILTMDKVFISLEEPEFMRPPPQPAEDTRSSRKKKKEAKQAQLDTPDTKKKKKRKIDTIIKGLRIIINEAHFNIKLLPRQDNGAAPWAPHLRFDFCDIDIKSTNANWEEVNLKQTKVKNTQTKIESSYKLAVCKSFSVGMVSDDNQTLLPIIDQLPVQIQITTFTSLATNMVTGVDMNCVLEAIHFSWTQISWSLVVKLFSSMRMCLEREVPQEVLTVTEPKLHERKKKVSGALETLNMNYKLLVKDWSMSFHRTESDGYRFEGKQLLLEIAPKTQVMVEGKALFDSKISMSAESFNFGQINPHPSIEKRVQKVISQRVRHLSEITKQDGFISFDILHRWAKLDEPKSTNLSINLEGFQVVLDRETWKGFYKFLAGDIIDIVKLDISRSKAEKKEKEKQRDEKEIENQVSEILAKIKISPSKMSDYFYWFHNSRVNININNTMVIVPKDYYLRPDGVQLNREMRVVAKRLTFSNCSDWNNVPYMSESLSGLTHSSFADFATKANNTSNKFQFDVVDVTADTLEHTDGPTSVILLPSTMRIYGRYLEKNPNIEIQPSMELALHASSFRLTINEVQEAYFKQMIPLYRRWYHKLDKEIKSVSAETKEEILASFEEGKRTAKIVAAKLVDEAIPDDIKEVAKSNTIQAVEEAVKAFQFAFLFKADSGSLEVPLHNIDKILEESVPVNEAHQPLSLFNFDGMELVVENTLRHQLTKVQLKSFEAKNLDHPKSPSALSLLPLARVSNDYLNDDNSQHFTLTCFRHRPLNSKPSTEIAVYLQGMQVVSRAKKEAMKGLSKDLEDAIPDLKRVAKRITDTLVGATKDEQKVEKDLEDFQEKMKEGITIAEKALDYLDLSWSFNLADCELVLLESDPNKKPFGCIKVSSFNKEKLSNRFDDLHDELITAKLAAATTNTQLGEIMVERKELLDVVNKLETRLKTESEKKAQELQNIEQQLMLSKMSLMDAQNEIEELKRQLRNKK